MRRSLWLSLAFLSVLAGAALHLRAESKPTTGPDPWVGEYVKFGEYEFMRRGEHGQAPRLRIVARDDGYRLEGGNYGERHFRNQGQGVISDGHGGIGRITHGWVEFADGKRLRALRADFCYEQFYLVEKQIR